MDSSHWIILNLLSSLNLTRCRLTWSLNFLTQSRREKGPLSKILEFLRFQISHVAKTKISMEKGIPDPAIMSRTRISGGDAAPQCKPILFQQLRAKAQVKKRCSKSSSLPVEHKTQKEFGWTLKCRRSNMFLVFSRSTNKSQAKNFSLGVHLDF